jgi:hypothetical protein
MHSKTYLSAVHFTSEVLDHNIAQSRRNKLEEDT